MRFMARATMPQQQNLQVTGTSSCFQCTRRLMMGTNTVQNLIFGTARYVCEATDARAGTDEKPLGLTGARLIVVALLASPKALLGR